MSYTSFIEGIEELKPMPALEKGDGGYFYPPDLVGNVYRNNDKLLYVTKSTIDEIQLPLIEAIYMSIENAIKEDVQIAIHDSIECQLEDLTAKFNTLDLEVMSVLEKTSKRLEESDSQKITTAVVRKLIVDEIPKASHMIETSNKKIKLSTLTMLKEEGYTISDIAELKNAELI